MPADVNAGFITKYYSRAQLQATPSRRDGIDAAKEANFRQQTRNFLARMAALLKLNMLNAQTALMYVERFYAFRSYAKNDRYLVAAAALFLAAKSMDGPRPVGHVALAYLKTKATNKPDELAALEKEPERKVKESGVIDSIIFAERALLYTLNFQVKLDLPHNFIDKQLVKLGVVIQPGSKDLPFVSRAYEHANASVKSKLPLQYHMEKICAASIYKASKEMHRELVGPEGKDPLTFFGITELMVDDMFDQLNQEGLLKPYEPNAQGDPNANLPPPRASMDGTAGPSQAAAAQALPAEEQQPGQAAASGVQGGQAQAAGGAAAKMLVAHAPSIEEGELLDDAVASAAGSGRGAAASQEDVRQHTSTTLKEDGPQNISQPGTQAGAGAVRNTAAADGDAHPTSTSASGREHLEDSANEGVVGATVAPAGAGSDAHEATTMPLDTSGQQASGQQAGVNTHHSSAGEEHAANKKRKSAEAPMAEATDGMSHVTKCVRVA